MRARGWLLACLLLGCGGESEPERPTPSESSEEQATPEAEPEAEPEPDPEAAAQPPPRPDRAARAELRNGRREARRLSRDGDQVAAWERFAQLIERSPESPQLRCEGGSVARRAEQLDDAERELDRGLALLGPLDTVAEPLRVTAAQCLYDRGRVHEARDEISGARSAYEASLVLRDNRVVRERLGQLNGPDAETQLVDVPTLEALTAHLAREGCGAMDEPPEITVVQQRTEPDAAWLREVCIGMYGTEEVQHIVARRAEGGWRLEAPFLVYDGGRAHSLSFVRAEEIGQLELIEHGEQRALAIRARLRIEEGMEDCELYGPDDEGRDVDCLSTDMTTYDRSYLVLCMDDCRTLRLREERAHRAEVQCSVGTDEGYTDIEPPDWAGGGGESASRWSLAMRWSEGRATFSVRDGEPPAVLRRLTREPRTIEALYGAMSPVVEYSDNGY